MRPDRQNGVHPPGKTAKVRSGKTAAGPEGKMREGMDERRVNRAGVGPVLTLSIFSPAGFLDYGGYDLSPT